MSEVRRGRVVVALDAIRESLAGEGGGAVRLLFVHPRNPFVAFDAFRSAAQIATRDQAVTGYEPPVSLRSECITPVGPAAELYTQEPGAFVDVLLHLSGLLENAGWSGEIVPVDFDFIRRQFDTDEMIAAFALADGADPEAVADLVAAWWAQPAPGRTWFRSDEGGVPFEIRDDQAAVLLTESLRRGLRPELLREDAHGLSRRVEFLRPEQGVVARRVDGDWHADVADLRALVELLAPHLAYAAIRRLAGFYEPMWWRITSRRRTGPRPDPSPHEYDRLYPQRKDISVPDVHGIALLTDSHLEYAAHLPGWGQRIVAPGKVLVTAPDPDRWFAGSTPDEDLLDEARAAFGDLLLRIEPPPPRPKVPLRRTLAPSPVRLTAVAPEVEAEGVVVDEAALRRQWYDDPDDGGGFVLFRTSADLSTAWAALGAANGAALKEVDAPTPGWSPVLGVGGPVITVDGPMLDIDHCDEEVALIAWAGSLAAHLEQAGLHGTITVGRAEYLPGHEPFHPERFPSATLRFEDDPPGSLAGHALEWCRGGGATMYVCHERFWSRVRPDELDDLWRRVLAAGGEAALAAWGPGEQIRLVSLIGRAPNDQKTFDVTYQVSTDDDAADLALLQQVLREVGGGAADKSIRRLPLHPFKSDLA